MRRLNDSGLIHHHYVFPYCELGSVVPGVSEQTFHCGCDYWFLHFPLVTSVEVLITLVSSPSLVRWVTPFRKISSIVTRLRVSNLIWVIRPPLFPHTLVTFVLLCVSVSSSPHFTHSPSSSGLCRWNRPGVLFVRRFKRKVSRVDLRTRDRM